MTDIEQQVCDFIVDNFLFGNSDDAPAPESSFLESGLIDSTGVLELVFFIEETWGFKVADEELIPENLDSVSQIAAFVTRKQSV